MAVWQYIKMKNLIKEDDYRVAVNDAKLKKIFLCDSIPFSSIIVALKHHITPVGSVDLQYQLPLDKACENELLEELNFDVDVGIEDDLIDAREEAMSSWEDLCHEQRKELNFLKKQVYDLLLYGLV
jgi:chromatin remodeling complex protein RSC6